MKTEVRRDEGHVAFNVTNNGRPTFVSPLYVEGVRMGTLMEVATDEQVTEAKAATPHTPGGTDVR